MDEKVQNALTAQIAQAPELSAGEKAERTAFFKNVRMSKVMASDAPELAPLQEMFEPTAYNYAVFRWMKRIAWICLGTVAATFVIVGISVAFSLRSHAAQYTSLRIGWPILQVSAAIEVLGQATLAVALSYWVTAVFGESYYPKLLVLVGICALVAVLALLKAVFKKVDNRLEAWGELLIESAAPTLWQRVRDLAAKLNTPAPDHIVIGIDANFYVTEHPVIFGKEELQGRVLYLSLPMLKIFAADEADWILGHELAHFSGNDTLWSRKISPLTGKFALTMDTLANSPGLPVAQFMLFFWKLYGLSMTRQGRAREFRADKVGAELVSSDAAKRALVKTSCYCEYRNQTELGIITSNTVDKTLNLARQLEEGYPAFLSEFTQSAKAIDQQVPHPFDTHPPLQNRLSALGYDARDSLLDPSIQTPPQSSWYHAIATAEGIEERMWKERQKALQSYQSESMAWRLRPSNDEERVLVEEHFPRRVFRNKEGAEAVLTYDSIQMPDWAEPARFLWITRKDHEDSIKGRRVTLHVQFPNEPKPRKVPFYPGPFVDEVGNLEPIFDYYFSRHQQAMIHTDP